MANPEDQANTFREFFVSFFCFCFSMYFGTAYYKYVTTSCIYFIQTTYNKMSELCFNQCIWDFGINTVRNREDRCIVSILPNQTIFRKNLFIHEGLIFKSFSLRQFYSESVC